MKRLPDHVAIVMDGCLQWGQRGGQDARASLLAGARATYETITAAQDLGLDGGAAGDAAQALARRRGASTSRGAPARVSRLNTPTSRLPAWCSRSTLVHWTGCELCPFGFMIRRTGKPAGPRMRGKKTRCVA